ncbi:MAG: EamA family transporter [Candidatus Bathyarchaeia archaeon]
MLAESLSLFTALCYGLSSVLIRKGVRNSNAFTGTFIAALVQVLVMSGLLALFPPKGIIWTGIAFFVASGILASALGRLCNYSSIELLGVPMTASIIGSSPLFSIVFAMLLLGEEVTIGIVFGTVLVVAGVALTSCISRRSLRLSRAFAFPILAAAFYGASSSFRKLGLQVLPEPILGTLVGALSTLAFLCGYLALGKNRCRIDKQRSCIGYFLGSGIIVSLGWLSMFAALLFGKVSVVSALIGTNPLFSLLLSLLFLRGSDTVNRRVAMGCVAVVVGATIITLN